MPINQVPPATSAVEGRYNPDQPPGLGLMRIPSLQLFPPGLTFRAGVPPEPATIVAPALAKVAKLLTVPPLVAHVFPVPNDNVPLDAVIILGKFVPLLSWLPISSFCAPDAFVIRK